MSQLIYDNLTIDEKRILLLKTLGVSNSTIDSLILGEADLDTVLAERIKEVIDNPEDITQCAIVCQNIKREHIPFSEFDPDPYLEQINELKARGGSFADDVKPSERSMPHYGEETGDASGPQIKIVSDFPGVFRIFGPESCTFAHPFVRYGARLVDMCIWLLLVNLLFRAGFGIDPMLSPTLGYGWVSLVYLCMLIFEPVMLHFFGTTPGKFIFGIFILNKDNEKMSFKEAYIRSVRLFRYGFGFLIPFYNFYRLFRSYASCRRGELLPWDIGTTIKRPEKTLPRHVIVFILIVMAFSSADTFANLYFALPSNKGMISEEQFYENCRHVISYNSMSFKDYPEYKVTTSNGKVVSVTWEVELEDADIIYDSYYQMSVAFLSFAGVAEGSDVITANLGLPNRYLNQPFAEFAFNYANIDISNKIECEGYQLNSINGYLYKTAGDGKHTYHQTFTMSR